MPAVLDAVIAHPPEVFCLQTRGPLVLRDLAQLQQLGERTTLRISFSLTTDRDDVQCWYEPHCASFGERLDAMRRLCEAGLRVHATLAPLLPCVAATSASAQDNAATRGGLLAMQRCGICHATGARDESPHRAAPPFRKLQENFPSVMLQSALRTGTISGHDEMPMFELSKADVVDLLTYIDTFSKPGRHYITRSGR